LTTGNEVVATITEKRYVHMGSAILALGHIAMITAAIITPTLINISPKT
jgi:hypothetical protein